MWYSHTEHCYSSSQLKKNRVTLSAYRDIRNIVMLEDEDNENNTVNFSAMNEHLKRQYTHTLHPFIPLHVVSISCAGAVNENRLVRFV